MTLKQKLFSVLVRWVLHPLGLETKRESDLLGDIYAALEYYHYCRGSENEWAAWQGVEAMMRKYMTWQTLNGPFYISLRNLLGLKDKKRP